MRDSTARRRAYWRGHFAEALALALLVLKGYWPVARRFSAAGGEIDLIVRRGDTIAFVEVKARGSIGAALTAIDAKKRRRFSRAVRAWLGRNAWAATRTLRADAVFIGRRAWPRHLEAAFDLDLI